ncbi:septal ring lytic transglycosylase RlpA family protein [Methylobacterium sp. NEAU K]|uniref:septal ring lytic transglycosylase RlpA family protein n=1 Tax=Methylobacterium sp. NEAU K TaxID=3064946 RepID=UPI002734AD22|nr:septal ring lytic transglycosylase RlpA family protein [Methylobacterium sp. NEAU K]MDP4005053.1 septal ring lytic transglycosylase RlpA family protein [Methylobacterium sp. NEAU K]
MTLRLSARAALACVALAGSAPCAPALADWTGKASFYGYESGRVRADGYAFDPLEFGAAHWTLPLCRRRNRESGHCQPVRVRVTDLTTGRSVVVPINDRGPHPRLHRLIDLSLGAARELGIEHRGVVSARVAIVR